MAAACASASASWKNPTICFVNTSDRSAYAIPIKAANCTAACAKPCAFSFSPRPIHCATCTCPPIRAMAASPCENQVNMPPTPTPATAFEPNSPIHAISVMLYKVPRNDDAMIGIASFVSVFKIGPFVKFPSIYIPHPFLFDPSSISIIHGLSYVFILFLRYHPYLMKHYMHYFSIGKKSHTTFDCDVRSLICSVFFFISV